MQCSGSAPVLLQLRASVLLTRTPEAPCADLNLSNPGNIIYRSGRFFIFFNKKICLQLVSILQPEESLHYSELVEGSFMEPCEIAIVLGYRQSNIES